MLLQRHRSSATITPLAVNTAPNQPSYQLLLPPWITMKLSSIRIQMQGELMRHGEYKVHYRNVPHAIYQIMKHDGLLRIYRGIIPATFYQIISQGFRLGLFQSIEDLGLTMDSNLEHSIIKSAISGAFCGAISAFIASPFFMVKNYQMIRSGSQIRVAHQRQYTSMLHAFYDIYRSYRLSTGLWRATGSNVLRVGVGSSVQLSSFVGIKNVLNLSVDYNERFLVFNTIMAALASGVLVSPIIASLDLIRVRMYIQPVDSNGRGLLYKNVWDCFRRIKAREGLLAFWKGSTGAFFYVMITSSITLVSWDEMRHVRNARLNSRDYIIDFGYQ
ncbi:solute carrier family 25 member 35-like isoform X3 [Varroa jacobsoni]|uniref:solute carrier family 25 member 35-like isoform X3 n=1 Tax=Varroa jacobsoni TaxID=62625 RepID=UPI000BF575AE|nr:solute carrier family 25 member 35-like isoform X3 [Varroa jacobsoni]